MDTDASAVQTRPEAHHVLVVEDNPLDVRLIEEGLEAGPASELHIVEDGQDAIDFLREGDKPRPDLVLLDLNLPRVCGHEVLEAVKQDPELADIPVVVFTTSEASSDVEACYRLHANSFVTKPMGYEPYVEAVHAVEEYWLDVSEPPPANGHAPRTDGGSRGGD